MLKRIWHDPVGSKVIAAAILAAVAAAGTYFLDWWPGIGQWISAAYGSLVRRTAVPNWLLGVLALLALAPIGVAVLAIGYWLFGGSPKGAQSDWRSYTTDHFFGLRWRWRYLSNGQPDDLFSFCPHCDFQVYPEDVTAFRGIHQITYRCESCGRTLGEFQESPALLESKVVRFIQQKIRNGTWAAPDRP